MILVLKLHYFVITYFILYGETCNKFSCIFWISEKPFPTYTFLAFVCCYSLFSSFSCSVLVRDPCFCLNMILSTCVQTLKYIKIRLSKMCDVYKNDHCHLFSLQSLLSPTAFSYASQYIARYEEQGIGRLAFFKIGFYL